MIGAILGHCHVVKCDLNKLHGNMHATIYTKSREPLTSMITAGFVLLWAIHMNDPDMVRCLTKDCGFQFRWLSNNSFEKIWQLLLLDYDNGAYDNRICKFSGEVDQHALMHADSRRERQWILCHASWKTKEHMMRVLIECGLPRDFIVPDDLDFSLLNGMLKKYRAIGKHTPSEEEQAKVQAYERSRPKKEKKIRIRLNTACAAYNWIQPYPGTEDEYDDEWHDDNKSDDSEDDDVDPHKKDPLTTRLDLPSFYNQLLGMWKDDQNMEQEMKLDVFEEYDPRSQRNDDDGEAAVAAEDESDSDSNSEYYSSLYFESLR